MDRKRGPAPEIAIEISRQAGKTTIIVDVVTFLMIWYPLRLGIFSPQREQAKTDFDRLKAQLNRITQLTGMFQPQEANANTLRLSEDSECYIFPVTPTSHAESKTLDLIITEESQSLNDHEFKNDIRPMGAATNAPIIRIGTAGYRICDFYRLLQKPGNLRYNYKEVIEQRREVFNKTQDLFHLNYETFVLNERERLGEDSDEFRVPYGLEWRLGGGQFITEEELYALYGSYERIYEDKENKCYVGIDTAKFPDRTVVTVERYNKQERKRQLINWLMLQGDNYKDQFDFINAFLKNYKVVAIAIDSTGQGDFMPDMFERETEWTNENNGLYRVKFSAVSKDMIYKNLLVSMKEKLIELPIPFGRESELYNQEMLDLQKEYKGQLLSCHHPDHPDAHDDFCDSHALAEWAFARTEQTGDVNIRFI